MAVLAALALAVAGAGCGSESGGGGADVAFCAQAKNLPVTAPYVPPGEQRRSLTGAADQLRAAQQEAPGDITEPLGTMADAFQQAAADVPPGGYSGTPAALNTDSYKQAAEEVGSWRESNCPPGEQQP